MAARQFTRKEVEARNRLGDAAIIINNVVYEVTEFLEDHPGGAEILMDNAGKDASQCFSDVGHSDIALEWREKFRVGEVVAEERRAAVVRSEPPPPAPPDRSLAGLLAVWGPPAALACCAALLYSCLFQ